MSAVKTSAEGALRTPAPRGRRVPHPWGTLVGLGLILSLVSCEYNADLTVRIPRWETGLAPVGVLGVSPRPAGAADEAPWGAADCEGDLSRVAIQFFLADERDAPVGEGDRVRVGTQLWRPSAARLLDAADTDQTIFVDLLSLDDGVAEPVSLVGTVEALRWRPTPVDRPAHALLLHDHGLTAGEQDGSDERLAAWSELVQEALCAREPALGCRLPEDTVLSLYRLSDDTVAPLVQRSRSADDLQQNLDELREAGERGVAPLFSLADGVSPGGIPQALSACGDGQCWPALILMSASDEPGAQPLSEADLPAGARLMAGGLTDSPALRRLACRTGGFFAPMTRPADLRLIRNRSTTDIPDYDYGFARQALMALYGQWEALVSLTGLPADLDLSRPVTLSGTLTVTLGTHVASTEFRVTLGGY